jgi:hypothetical protein
MITSTSAPLAATCGAWGRDQRLARKHLRLQEATRAEQLADAKTSGGLYAAITRVSLARERAYTDRRVRLKKKTEERWREHRDHLTGRIEGVRVQRELVVAARQTKLSRDAATRNARFRDAERSRERHKAVTASTRAAARVDNTERNRAFQRAERFRAVFEGKPPLPTVSSSSSQSSSSSRPRPSTVSAGQGGEVHRFCLHGGAKERAAPVREQTKQERFGEDLRAPMHIL